jgi:cold shock protein
MRQSYHGNRKPNGGPPRRHPSLPPLKTPADMREVGKLRWFDVNRGYGFIEIPNGPDVFVHASIVARYGLNDRLLEPGTPVRFAYMADAKRGPSADAICLAN